MQQHTTHPRDLDEAWRSAVAFIDSLPDERAPHISLEFYRLPDQHRQKTPKDIHVACSCTIAMKRIADEVTASGSMWIAHAWRKESPVAAVDSALTEAKAFLRKNPAVVDDLLA